MNILAVLLAGCAPQDATLSDATYHAWLAEGSSGTVDEGKLDLASASILNCTTDTGISDIEGSECPPAWEESMPSYFTWLDDDIYYVLQGDITPWRSEAIMTSEGDFLLTVHHDLGNGQDFRFAFSIDPVFQPIVCIQDGQTCYTGEDNDGDGLVDYDDPDCLVGGWEVGYTDSECNDGVDNDGDGSVDLDDADCDHAWDNAEIAEDPTCTDGSDDDGDGYIDGQDPDCLNFGAEDGGGHWNAGLISECNDGLDNDGDGATDADDGECADSLDNDEDGFNNYSACNDDVDNDGDGWVDKDDADCDDSDEFGFSTGACMDGLDNDGDGDVDSADSGCYYTVKGEAFAASMRLSEEDLVGPTCGNSKDDDGDGWVDFEDPDCLWGAAEDNSIAFACADGVDNDGDGDIDAADGDCYFPTDNDEADNDLNCDDGIDNDGDGWTDGDDPECALYDEETSFLTTGCNDGQDNDGDGDIDAADSGCDSAEDNDEDAATPSCSNGVDDDGDTWIDHDDPDCALGEFPGGEDGNTTFECSDGQDNDGDGLTDADDPECNDAYDNLETSTWSCEDGFDNDGDGWTDGGDPECTSIGYERGYTTTLCNDGSDNDGDGLADYDDPGCFGATDDAEEDEDLCADGADNDSDGWTDTDDPDCAGGLKELGADSPFISAYECNDGLDNDGDGATDADDADCEYAWDNIEAEETGGDPLGFPLDYGVTLDKWSEDEQGHTIHYLNAGSYQLNPSDGSDFWVLPQEWLSGYGHAKFAAEEFDIEPTWFNFIDADPEAPDADYYAAAVTAYDEESASWAAELAAYGLMNKELGYKLEDNSWRPVNLSDAGLDNWAETSFSWVRISEGSDLSIGGSATGDFQMYMVGRESGSNLVIQGSFDVTNIREDKWGYPILEDALIAQNETPVCTYESGTTAYD